MLLFFNILNSYKGKYYTHTLALPYQQLGMFGYYDAVDSSTMKAG